MGLGRGTRLRGGLGFDGLCGVGLGNGLDGGRREGRRVWQDNGRNKERLRLDGREEE